MSQEELPVEEPPAVKSELQRYLESNPQLGGEIARILVTLYQDPPKVSSVRQTIQDMLQIEPKDPSIADDLRGENYTLQKEIFEMQDKLLVLEKEWDEIKEEDI